MSCTLRQMTIGALAPDLRDDVLTVTLRRPGDAGAGEEGCCSSTAAAEDGVRAVLARPWPAASIYYLITSRADRQGFWCSVNRSTVLLCSFVRR